MWGHIETRGEGYRGWVGRGSDGTRVRGSRTIVRGILGPSFIFNFVGKWKSAHSPQEVKPDYDEDGQEDCQLETQEQHPPPPMANGTQRHSATRATQDAPHNEEGWGWGVPSGRNRRNI